MVSELRAGADADFPEDLAQVAIHRARADEQLRGDVTIGVPFAHQSSDLCLLRSELIGGFNSPFSGALTRSLQLQSGPLGKSLSAHLGEHVVGDL